MRRGIPPGEVVGGVGKGERARRMVPALSWLPEYDHDWLRPDLIAGLTLWGLLVPETMAYAGIAGLPAQAGLYTLASLLVYALLGTSRHRSVRFVAFCEPCDLGATWPGRS